VAVPQVGISFEQSASCAYFQRVLEAQLQQQQQQQHCRDDDEAEGVQQLRRCRPRCFRHVVVNPEDDCEFNLRSAVPELASTTTTIYAGCGVGGGDGAAAPRIVVDFVRTESDAFFQAWASMVSPVE
jgi:hypothetical protein